MTATVRRLMNIYLDESYNFQRTKGKLFISINGFAVLNDKALRKRWQAARKPYLQSKRRIHATDSQFIGLKEKSIKLLGRHEHILGLRDIASLHQLSQRLTTARRVAVVGNGGISLEVIHEVAIVYLSYYHILIILLIVLFYAVENA